MALPVDDILNDAVNVMERYIGHEPDVVERLQRILRHARDIKQVIQKVGQSMAPAQALPAGTQIEKRPTLERPANSGGRCRRNRSQRRPQFAGTLRLHRGNGPRRRRSRVHGAQHAQR